MTNTYPSAPPLASRFITVDIDDISTGASFFVVPGFRGEIVKISTVLNGAITNADADVTCEIGGTLVAGSLITIAASGSGAGVVDTAVPTGANVFDEDEAIEVITDGASTGAVKVTVTLECRPV